MRNFDTQKLFQKDSYLKNCESFIFESSENYLILNQTVFYPESGGQPGDTGKLIIDG